ncbi:hypothetical protein FRB94_009884 [Tulasnella sp. JGI-2019a]|nr:hypothetical protein FRB94_009884 [Tulasnella sp. JGI-2019a]
MNKNDVDGAVLQRRMAFCGLNNNRNSTETKLCQSTVAILRFVQEFYRKKGVHGDESWSIAKEPPASTAAVDPAVNQTPATRPATRSQTHESSGSKEYLQRVFVTKHKIRGKLTGGNTPTLEGAPDISLILTDPRPNSISSENLWADIKVAFEVKADDTPLTGVDTFLQAASYAHSMKIEQFDRKFCFTVSVSPDGCRVWRWDTVAGCVTKFIDFATDTTGFIQAIGRLATMDPEAMGYDTHFSNAGRVLGHQVKSMRTTLTIIPTKIQEPGSSTPPLHDTPPRVYVLTRPPLYQARGALFGQSTAAWLARLQNDGQGLADRVITEKWQDDARVSEAWFFSKANEVGDCVAHMDCSEQSDGTRQYHAGLTVTRIWNSSIMKTTWDPTNSSHTAHNPAQGAVTSSEPKFQRRKIEAEDVSASDRPTYERYLLRLVTADVGIPLRLAKGPRELLGATVDAVKGLWELWKKFRILHRDISSRNVLLTKLKDNCEGKRGLVVDFGLAAIESGEDNVGFGVPTATHHDPTGTLPYMAYQLLNNPACLHRVHHDLESFFWLLLCECLQASMEFHEEFAKAQGGLTEKMLKGLPSLRRLGSLRDQDGIKVMAVKSEFLLNPNTHIKLDGRHAPLQPFMTDYAKTCFKSSQAECGEEGELLTFDKVVELMERTLAMLPDDPTSTSSSETPPPIATSDPVAGPSRPLGSKRSRSSSMLTESGEEVKTKRSKVDHI